MLKIGYFYILKDIVLGEAVSPNDSTIYEGYAAFWENESLKFLAIRPRLSIFAYVGMAATGDGLPVLRDSISFLEPLKHYAIKIVSSHCWVLLAVVLKLSPAGMSITKSMPLLKSSLIET